MQNIHEPDDDEVDDDNPPSKSSKNPLRILRRRWIPTRVDYVRCSFQHKKARNDILYSAHGVGIIPRSLPMCENGEQVPTTAEVDVNCL